MKRVVLASAASLVAASPAFVHAQSAVTLYGLVDAGITYTNNQKGASNIQQTSGKLSGSRWGLRGVEDLGDGLKTVFRPSPRSSTPRKPQRLPLSLPLVCWMLLAPFWLLV